MNAREDAGLSQTQLAEKLGVLQRTVAYWERRPSALQPDLLAKLALALNVHVEKLLFDEPPNGRAVRGPTGKIKTTFEEVTKLPKREQEKIIDVVRALIAQSAAV